MALIPARGGSKGLPGKNLKPLLGKPLIAWTIEQALKSRLLDYVAVSTDDKEIAEASLKYGAKVPFMRPAELASDTSRVADTMIYTLDALQEKGETFDYIVLLEPTSPLRKEDDIDRAVAELIAHPEADSLIGLGEASQTHPAYAKRVVDGVIKPYAVSEDVTQMRQTLSRIYYIYGGIYISKTESLRKTREAYAGVIVPLYVEKWQQFEIDDIWDFHCTEAIMRQVGGFK